jgi:hypothetical protein
MAALLLGLIVLAYWVVHWVFLLGDYYLTSTGVAVTLKLLLPVAVSCNLVCIVASICRIRHGRRGRVLASLVLNALPLIVSAGIFAWLFFGLRM